MFFGKFVNQKEVEFINKEGIAKFKSKLDVSKREGIKLLVKGKKIYRIFTRSKLKSLQNNLIYDQNILELIEDRSNYDVESRIEEIESDLNQAMKLILRAINTLSEIKKNKTL